MIKINSENATTNAVDKSLQATVASGEAALGNITESSAKSPRGTKNRYKYHLLDAAQKYLPNHRVGTCQKVPVGYGNNLADTIINVGKTEHGQMKFAGLGHCANLWQCPCCASNVGYKKAAECSTAMALNAKSGGQSLFLTLTQPHTASEPLRPLMERQNKSCSGVFQNGTVKRFLKKHGYLGMMRAFEATHGCNGWHPHLHIILIFDKITVNKELRQLEDLIYKFWSRYIVQNGGQLPSTTYGVDLRLPKHGTEKEVGSYIAKFADEVSNGKIKRPDQTAMELAYSHTKKGRAKQSRTPFQILDDLADEYNPTDAALYREWADCTQGRTRVYWSPGLKAHFNIKEISDQELADAPVPKVRFSIPWAKYKIIRQHKLAGALLDLAEYMEPSFCINWVNHVNDLHHELERAYGVIRFRERQQMKRQIQLDTEQHLRELGLLH